VKPRRLHRSGQAGIPPGASRNLPGRQPPVASGMARPTAKSRNPFGFLKRFEPRCRRHHRRIAEGDLASFAETRYLTIVVAIVAIVMGIFLGALDLGFGWIIEKVFFS
jgi:hypothetical protein